MLAGHRRYAHSTALRGNAVAAQALGMNKVVSEDALRQALERIDEPTSRRARPGCAQPVGHREVVVVDKFLALEDDLRHLFATPFENMQ